MIKVENIEVFGWGAAIRGMRNPMNSWDKSDSGVCGDFAVQYKDGELGCDHKCPKWSENNYCGYCENLQKRPYDYFMIGPRDLDLMRRLFNAGTEHRKYLRMIHVQMDITAPLYWWKEYDTYKVGTVVNGCSTMHKIHDKKFEISDFSCEHLFSLGILKLIVDDLNYNRNKFIKTKSKDCWWQMIQLLPTSYNQRRTVDINYEVVMAMIRQRTGHKLDEWNEFIRVLEDLPYVKEISRGNKNES